MYRTIALGLIMIFVSISLGEGKISKKPNQIGHIKVKGFYLGMPVKECIDLINSKYLSAFMPEKGYIITAYDSLTLGANLLDKYAHSTSSFDSVFNIGSMERPDSIAAFVNNKTHEFYYKKCYYNPLTNAIGGSAFYVSAKNQTIEGVIFSASQVNILFNVEDLSSTQFMEMIVKNYKIPPLSLERQDGEWVYISPEGWKMEILDDKGFGFYIVAKAEERKFD
jgi:hypothetical protein